MYTPFQGAVPIGDTGAVCVKSDESFGVVSSTNTGISCLTCKYGKSSCDHVKRVKLLASDSIDTPPHLEPFSESNQPVASDNLKFESSHKLQSYKRIPFECTQQLSETICKPDADRFRIVDNVCNLKDGEPSDKCPHCSSVCVYTTTPTTSSVITSKRNYSAKGKTCPKSRVFYILILSIYIYIGCSLSMSLPPNAVYSKECSMPSCSGVILFDGQSMGLLCMGAFCITYEILRTHMYHFFMGR